MLAIIVVFSGDPGTQIGALQHPAFVMKADLPHLTPATSQ
jgi:hypothetical protein